MSSTKKAESHYTDDYRNAGEFFEGWLRKEPTANSLKMWIGEDDKLQVHICDFDGHRLIEAINLDAAAHILQQSEFKEDD